MLVKHDTVLGEACSWLAVLLVMAIAKGGMRFQLIAHYAL